MFEDIWYTIKEGVLMLTVIAFAMMIIPSSAALGIYFMGKLIPQIAPTCEVRK